MQSVKYYRIYAPYLIYIERDDDDDDILPIRKLTPDAPQEAIDAFNEENKLYQEALARGAKL